MIVEKGWFIPTLQFGPDDVFLVEDWEETPAGPYRAVFHFTPEDYRTLYVDGKEGGELVSSLHRFDRRVVTSINSRRRDGKWILEVDTGERGILRLEVAYGEDKVLRLANRLTPHLPEAVAANRIFCRLLPRLAAPLLGTDPGQRIVGVTELGRHVRFRLEKIYTVTDARCSWAGRDLGPLCECRYSHDMGDFRPVSRAVVSRLSLLAD